MLRGGNGLQGSQRLACEWGDSRSSEEACVCECIGMCVCVPLWGHRGPCSCCPTGVKALHYRIGKHDDYPRTSPALTHESSRDADTRATGKIIVRKQKIKIKIRFFLAQNQTKSRILLVDFGYLFQFFRSIKSHSKLKSSDSLGIASQTAKPLVS